MPRPVRSLGHAEFEHEAADLYGRAAAGGRRDEQRAHGVAPAALVCVGLAHGVAARSAVEGEVEAVVVHALVAEDVLSRLQVRVAYTERRLRDEEVGILTFGGVAGGDHDDAGDEAPAAVGHAGGGAELRLDVLLDDGGARGDHAAQLLL